MITVTLTAHAERRAPAGAIPEYIDSRPLLDHQVRTYAALKDHPLVMNTYPTGTGKTVAALLRLLHPDQRRHNTLLIAPTNALIDQHAADAAEFIEHNGLEMRVLKLNAATIDQLTSATDLRRGEAMQRWLANPLTFYEQLGLPADARKQPFVVVTNPDIFYLVLYFRYGRLDQRNVFDRLILQQFQYIIIDEFHYYDAKQFANFLFFFTFWRDWGLFENRRICLLSATPTEHVYRYLDRVFYNVPGGWTRIGPDNEPAESAAYATTPTLTELQMTVEALPIEQWVQQQRDQIIEWHRQELDTAIISSSLGRINEIYAALSHLNPTPVRITGPEPFTERQRVAPIILATPTVDIGYNFGRPGKHRQSIDRLVCDARFGDEITQRIGRAGRVLGRQETTTPSQAVVLVSPDAYDELQPYDGRTLTRSEWAALVAQLQNLPPKHRLEGYIHSNAIMESFYPLFKLQGAVSSDTNVIDDMLPAVRDVFAPNSKLSAKYLSAFFRAYEQRKTWFRKSAAERWAPGNYDQVAYHVAAYLTWLGSSKGVEQRCPPNVARQYLDTGKFNRPPQRQAVEDFMRWQVAVTDALFNFREAWQGPQALVLDEKRLLSSERINRYDLLHLLANYDLEIIPDRSAFEQLTGSTEKADLYLQINGFRRPKWVLSFSYQPELARAEFEERMCRSVVALQGLQLVAREQGEDQILALPQAYAQSIKEHWIPCLIVPEESWGMLISVLRGSPFYARDLNITYLNGLSVVYKVLTGTAGFHILPELIGHYKMLDRKKYTVDAIFL